MKTKTFRAFKSFLSSILGSGEVPFWRTSLSRSDVKGWRGPCPGGSVESCEKKRLGLFTSDILVSQKTENDSIWLMVFPHPSEKICASQIGNLPQGSG